MATFEYPTFLDFEASSLGSASYPIEVAWNMTDGAVESHLISPAGIEQWTGWSAKAESLHGIARAVLLAQGKRPSWVCDRMIEQLAGRTVYVEDPTFDEMWLAALFSAGRRAEPTLRLVPFDDLLLEHLKPRITVSAEGRSMIQRLKTEARRRLGKHHRAAGDVEFMKLTWRLCKEDNEATRTNGG